MINDKIPKVNQDYEIQKAIIENALPSATVKSEDESRQGYIYPFVPVTLCDNLILQTVFLGTCIDILSEDMVFNDITLKGDDENTDRIKKFWQNNQEELNNQIIDYNSYGFGASEVRFNSNGDVIGISQIPADTLCIRKIKNSQTGEYLYFAQQQVNGKSVLLKIIGYEYPAQYDELPWCFWIGGGRKSNFFDYPKWINAFNHVSASVSLDKLDAKKLADGNLVSGILTIVRPPKLITDESVEDTLEEKMTNKGSGIFTLELNTLNPEIPLTVDYVQISESNYDYLEKLADKSDAKILATFKIPKARLLIDDVTESMNSNKTNTLYKIYSKELNNRQIPLERNMQKFNKIFFNNDLPVEVETPVFVDDKEIEADTTLKLFNNGLLTLGQAINKVKTIYPELDEVEIDTNNPIYQERYYNGRPLGFDGEEPSIYTMGDLIDMEKINEVFSREDTNR